MRIHEQKKKKTPLLILLLLAIGPIALGVSLLWFTRTNLFLVQSISVPATVARVFQEPSMYDFGKAVIEFHTTDGAPQRKSFHTSARYKKGDRVRIAFSDGDMKDARIKNFTELYSENIYFTLFGLLLCFPWALLYIDKRLGSLHGPSSWQSPHGSWRKTERKVPPFETVEDLQDAPETVILNFEAELFEFHDPLTGMTRTYSSREEIPPDLVVALKQASNFFTGGDAAEGSSHTFQYTASDGSAGSCSQWEDLPHEIRLHFEEILEEFKV